MIMDTLNKIIRLIWAATGIADTESCWDEEMKVQEKSPEEDSDTNYFTITYRGNRYQVLVRKII